MENSGSIVPELAYKKGKLNAAFVRTVNRSGVYGDEHGLRLRVYESRKLKWISKHWIWRGTVNGRRRDAGLGSFPYVSLVEARQAAFECRKIARAGGDPLALRRCLDAPTFAEVAETVIGIHREGWKDAGRSEKQWRASLRDYAMGRLGRKQVDQISTADVMAVLIPHWHTRNETMRRVRQRIGAVMKWAVAQGLRADNPAGEAISAALPKPGGMRKHHRALPFAEVGAALNRVKASKAYRGTVLAFEFLVLTACRSGEVRLATWDEVDLEAETWTVPASRMKAKRDHRVPLSRRALEILHEARRLSNGGRLGIPVGARPGDQRQRGLQAPPGPRDRGRAARVPFVLQGLGGGALRRAARGLRDRPGSREFGPGGGRLSPDRPVRATPGADGRVVRLRGAGRRRRRGYEVRAEGRGEAVPEGGGGSAKM